MVIFFQVGLNPAHNGERLAIGTEGIVAQEDMTKTSIKQPIYFPNTEKLRTDEMRVTTLGTGLPKPISNDVSIIREYK